MTDTSDFEIPKSLRDLAEKNIDQARQNYDQFLDASRKAEDMVRRSSSAMGSAAKDVQTKMLAFTEANMKAGFDHANRLTKAASVREALEIQADYAQKQMETYARQAQELSQLMAKAGQKSD